MRGFFFLLRKGNTMSSISLDEEYYPYSVALEITLACNMRCLHCASHADGQNREKPLTWEEWCKVIDDLKRLKTRYFTLSGGEPFLYPRWRNLIEYIKTTDDGYTKVLMISNGSHITEEDIVFLKEKKASYIALSLDGDEEIHDYIRQYPGAFQNIMNVISFCHKNAFKASLVTSINKYNFSIRKKILDIVIKAGVKNWQVQIVNSFGRAGEKKESMIIDKEQYVELIDDLYVWREEYKDVVNILPADSIGYCHEKIQAMLGDNVWQGCPAGQYSLGIEANGNVKGCLSLQSDSFVAGNVRERSILDIWNDDSAFAYTRQYDTSLMQGQCGKCESARDCKAGCLGMAYSLHNTIYENTYCYKSILKSKQSVQEKKQK